MFMYIDDILTFSEDEETYSREFEQVLQKLNKYDLKNYLSKYLFGPHELDFLEFSVSGIKPSARKLAS